MNKLTGIMAVIVSMALGGGSTVTAGQEKENAVSSSTEEQPTGESVKGTLLKIEGQYFVIRGHDGEQVRVHVDESSKLDRVVEGDMVKAFITKKGHVTTLQRLEK